VPPQNPGYPASTPVPAVPLNFPPSRQFERKPAAVTAIGVLSIIIALATMPAVVFTPPPRPATPAPVVQQGPEEDEIDGLPKAQRQLVIAALNRAKQLTPRRTRQLDALLAGKGRAMFPTAEQQGANVQTIRQDVTDSGVLPSASPNKSGPHYFIIGTGRIEVYDTHAVFRPTGSGEVTSVSIDESKPSPQPQTPLVVATPAPNAAAVKQLASPAIAVALEAVLSGALAIYLLISGILVLRGSLSGSRLHWVYICIKIPLVIAAAIATWWLWSAYLATLTQGGPRGGFASGAAVLVLIGVVFAAVYPIILIFLFRSSMVRDYYRTARQEALAQPY
jgi:hypothetical protein